MADKKVVLGLSGGVDSAVAAQRLLGQGYEVHGLYLDIGLGGEQSARDNAAKLGIPLTVRSIQQELEEHVCAPFAADYLSGRTPIPCAVCNRAVKFPALISFAREIGANWVATGHYARIGTGCDGGPILLRGNSANAQAYLLSRLTRAMPSHVLFPLGDGPTEHPPPQADAGPRGGGALSAPRPPPPRPPGGVLNPARRRRRRAGRRGRPAPAGELCGRQRQRPGRPQGLPPLHHRPAPGAGGLLHRAAVCHRNPPPHQ